MTLHPTLFNTPLIYGPAEAKQAMIELYEEYIGVARKADLPLLLTAPTWRLDAARIAQAAVPVTINSDAVSFLLEVRERSLGEQPILVGALTGPQGDCYRPDLAPDSETAEHFHSVQIRELASTEADFLQAQTMPSVREATGVARAMAATGLPYIISFCTGGDGRVLDGTPLPEAMSTIDQATHPRPVGYYVNCTHPKFLLEAYPPGALERLIGIQANASSKDVTQLDGSGSTEADLLCDWTEAMLTLHDLHSVPVLGGCCGTSVEHLRALSD